MAVESLHRFTLSPAGIRFYFDPRDGPVGGGCIRWMCPGLSWPAWSTLTGPQAPVRRPRANDGLDELRPDAEVQQSTGCR